MYCRGPGSGGNLTGMSLMNIELTAKRLELLSELVPQASAIWLLVNPNNASTERIISEAQEAALRERGAAFYPEGPEPKARSTLPSTLSSNGRPARFSSATTRSSGIGANNSWPLDHATPPRQSTLGVRPLRPAA